MATEVMRRVGGAVAAVPPGDGRRDDLTACARVLRPEYLLHRDGARIFSGTRMTDPDVVRMKEPLFERWPAAGWKPVDAVDVVTAFVVGLVIEEPERRQSTASDPTRYSVTERDAWLGEGASPVKEAGHLHGDGDQRFERHLGIVNAIHETSTESAFALAMTVLTVLTVVRVMTWPWTRWSWIWSIVSRRSTTHVIPRGWSTPGRRSLDIQGDSACALHRLGMRGVHLQVIDHAPVDHIRLGRGHPGDAIASCDLTVRGDRTVTPDADPQHPQFAQSFLPSPLRVRSAEEDLIDDDPGARTGHRGDPLDPRRLQRPELRPDDHLSVRSELDPAVRRLHGGRHRLNQHVCPKGQPRIRQDRLQTPNDPGLPRTGTAVENDHLSRHRATVGAPRHHSKRISANPAPPADPRTWPAMLGR